MKLNKRESIVVEIQVMQSYQNELDKLLTSLPHTDIELSGYADESATTWLIVVETKFTADELQEKVWELSSGSWATADKLNAEKFYNEETWHWL